MGAKKAANGPDFSISELRDRKAESNKTSLTTITSIR